MLPRPADETVGSHPRAAELLASDRERERTVALLREGAADGRLTLEELEQRSDEAFRARTRAQLAALTRDLPVPPPRAGARTANPRRARRRPPRHQLVAFVAVNLLLVVVWAATGAGYFWPIWPLLGWGIGIAGHVLPTAHGPRPRHHRHRLPDDPRRSP